MIKQVADILLVNGRLVTMDDQLRVYTDGAVAIKANTIAAVGNTTDLETQFEADTVIDCTGCIISPGLINAHTHVPMTLLRGLADDCGLMYGCTAT
jgi:5-methylthioadenosine/S-adenosylhomocysteine deaminase